MRQGKAFDHMDFGGISSVKSPWFVSVLKSLLLSAGALKGGILMWGGGFGTTSP